MCVVLRIGSNPNLFLHFLEIVKAKNVYNLLVTLKIYIDKSSIEAWNES